MKREYSRFTIWGSYYAFAVNGMAVLIMGAIMPYISQEYGLRYDEGGTLLALQAVGNLLSSMSGGIISDYIGRKTMLIVSAIFFMCGFLGIAFTSTSLMLYVFAFISGMGWGIMNSMINAIISDVTDGDAGILNMLHMFFGIGAFIAPFLIGVLVNLDMSWRYGIYILVALSAIMLFIFINMSISSPKDDRKEQKTSFEFLSNIRYFIFLGILFFYVGTENSINGWLVTYLVDSGIISDAASQNTLSAFWIAVIIGRLITAYISSRVSKERMLMYSSIGGAICFALFVLSNNTYGIMGFTFATGIFMASIYPLTVANASSIIKGSGSASGILFAIGGLGGAVMPYINGKVSESANDMRVGMITIIVSAVLLSILSIINVFMARKKERT